VAKSETSASSALTLPQNLAAVPDGPNELKDGRYMIVVRLNKGIDPTEWATHCRLMATCDPKLFSAVRERVRQLRQEWRQYQGACP